MKRNHGTFSSDHLTDFNNRKCRFVPTRLYTSGRFQFKKNKTPTPLFFLPVPTPRAGDETRQPVPTPRAIANNAKLQNVPTSRTATSPSSEIRQPVPTSRAIANNKIRQPVPTPRAIANNTKQC